MNDQTNGDSDGVRLTPKRGGKRPQVSSSVSTGGAGNIFEQHVGAYWLGQLLVGAVPPILIDTTVAEVSFQTEHLGWHTDDFLVVCTSGSASRRIAGQVKRSFTVSASDEDCVRAVSDFWNDFNASHFSQEFDVLTLVTLRGTNTLLEHFVGLLDCARAARHGDEFEQRLATHGFVSEKATRYCRELQKIIGDVEAKPISPADIWPFLRVLYVLSLDLHTATRQTEAQVKSMFALTATGVDPVADANASWNELVGEVSTAMVGSRTLRRADLPAATLARHGVIGTEERRVLQALEDHTAPVLRGIRSTLGRDLHLARAALVQKILGALENAQVVVIAGPAGSGKSAIAKDAVGILALSHFLFGFRVDEFAQAHLDATLTAARVPANWPKLRAILGAQDRKVVLIESVERLLEKTTRDAFSDFMAMAADDTGLRIVLTCRDYSVEQVRASLLHPFRIDHAIISVPPLNDAELAEAEAAYPSLAIPLRNSALRKILRNPFVLDRGLDIPWSAEKSLPETEREFRALFWREIVRGNRVAPVMGRLREEALQTVAVRRGRALTSYVPVTELDPTVVESLLGDSLIMRSDENPLLVATAHDVIEDWAILQWLEEQHLAEASLKRISGSIGTHPSVRRSYRKWVAELVDRDAASADRLFRAAVSETEISVQFRDDTLVSLLKAPSAPDFLARHEPQLLANQRELLKRVIYLLRLACVKTPDWLPSVGRQGSILNVPDGSAWSAVLRLVHTNLGAFGDSERALLLGLVEDAVSGVSWWAPSLESAEEVAAIAHWLLDGLGGYGGDEPRKRVLKVIAKIPKADPPRFETRLRGHVEEGQRRDVVADDFRELIYAGIDGMPAARDLPDVVISVGEDYLLASETDLDDTHRFTRSSLDIDLYFGIKEGLRHDSFPPSAFRGPWNHLLRHHPTKALDFYVKVFNHSADWYAHPRLPERLEKAWEVELTFADGTTRRQWMNGRLWGLYRGMSVGPYPLQSMLMALEAWLLEVGKQIPEQVDGILVDLLRRSENCAITAVVASVATAYPYASGEALLVLLSVPNYIAMDRSRLVGEQETSATAGMFTGLRAGHQVYEMERKQANSLQHRRSDLEAAISNLQLGPLAPRVHALLDKHLAALPPKEQQDKEHLLWRLAIHRMDFRQYTVSDTPGPEIPDPKAKPGDQPRRYVRLDPAPPEPDVQAMVDESASRLATMSARLGTLMWGVQAFHREMSKHNPAEWAERIGEAQAMDHSAAHEDGTRSAPGFVAAVCIRDRWSEMTPGQRGWCVDTACEEVLRHAEDADYTERVQNNPMSADRACVLVLPRLLGCSLAPTQLERVKTAFVAGLTHPVEQVQLYAAWSIDADLWATNRALALRSLNAIATEAAAIDKARDAQQARFYAEREDPREAVATATAQVRERFWVDGAIAEDAHLTIDISEGFGADALKRMLVILGRVPKDPIAIAAFVRASRTLAAWWTSDDSHRDRRHRNFHTESDVSERIQEFLLRTSPQAAQQVLEPLLAAVDRHSRELHWIMQGLTSSQDSNPNTPQYWFLWELIAVAAKRATWLSRLGKDRHPDGTELLSAVFLTSHWKDDVRHWRFLDGYAHLVHGFFEALPPTSIVLDDYARFLYHIGEQSLPDAFVRVAAALRHGDARKMLDKSNTVFTLEVLLQRYVYGRPLELKRDVRVREAVLFILDCLVESGSSAAFRMRDDFVTPAA